MGPSLKNFPYLSRIVIFFRGVLTSIAVETHGSGGGLFRTWHDAIHYAVVIATDRIELPI